MFKLHLLANATFWKLIWFILRSIKIVLTYFICITWPATNSKLTHISHNFLNTVLLLQRYHEMHESKYYISIVFSTNSNLVPIYNYSNLVI